MSATSQQMPGTSRDERGAWFLQALRGDSDAATRLCAGGAWLAAWAGA